MRNYKVINKGKTVLLTLPSGHFTTFDIEHLARVKPYKWYYQKERGVIQATIKNSEGKSRQKTILLHRVITDCPPDRCIDHKDGNPSNNRNSNLRICSHFQNMQNVKGKGVRFKRGKWEARISFQGKSYYLGIFNTEEQALEARSIKSKELRQEFAPEVSRHAL